MFMTYYHGYMVLNRLESYTIQDLTRLNMAQPLADHSSFFHPLGQVLDHTPFMLILWTNMPSNV